MFICCSHGYISYLHLYLINIHIFDYPDSRLSGLFTEVPMSPDNRGLTSVTFGVHRTLKVSRRKQVVNSVHSNMQPPFPSLFFKL